MEQSNNPVADSDSGSDNEVTDLSMVSPPTAMRPFNVTDGLPKRPPIINATTVALANSKKVPSAPVQDWNEARENILVSVVLKEQAYKKTPKKSMKDKWVTVTRTFTENRKFDGSLPLLMSRPVPELRRNSPECVTMLA